MSEAGKSSSAEQWLSSESFRMMIDSVKDYAIFMLDATGHIRTWNSGAARVKQYRPDEIIGKHFSIFYPAEDVKAGKCEMELDVAARTGRFEDEDWRIRKDGSRFWANVVISAIRAPDGELRGFAKVTRDLTERKNAEQAHAARLAAEAANRAKDEFMAVLGHELRNPLAPTLTALQMMKLKGEVRVSRELEIIERQLKHMVRLVDDLLDLSRITRGKLDLKKEPLDLGVVIARAVEVAAPLIEDRRHELVVDVPPADLSVAGDPVRLAQVFGNLLTNAAKYTDPGGRIDITVKVEPDAVVTEVRDNGIGIDETLLPRVFETFVQAPQASARSAGGMGIGLSLVRSFVQLHGGAVAAHSAGKGKGSVFTVRLPRLLSAAAKSDLPPARASTVRTEPARPLRVLIVDDNEDALVSAADVFELLGHQVETASTGAAALAIAQRFVPDVGLLDIGLPDMDGYELATRLRATFASTPVRLLAVTGYGQDTDRARSRQAGFDGHLVKPVDLNRLLQTIADLTSR